MQSKWGMIVRSSFAALAATVLLLSLSVPSASAAEDGINEWESITSALEIEVAEGDQIVDAGIDAESGAGFVVTTAPNAEGIALFPAGETVNSEHEDGTMPSVGLAETCRRSEALSLRKLSGGRMDGKADVTSTSACGSQRFCVQLGQRVGFWIASTRQHCYTITGARNVTVHIKSPAVCTTGRYYGLYFGWGQGAAPATPPEMPDINKVC